MFVFFAQLIILTSDILLKFHKFIFNFLLALNNIQNQIIDYQNKVYKFEDINVVVKNVKATDINDYEISGVTSFNINGGLINIEELLDKYINSISEQLNNMINEKNKYATIWLDSQYKKYEKIVSQYIEHVEKSLEALKKCFLSQKQDKTNSSNKH